MRNDDNKHTKVHLLTEQQKVAKKRISILQKITRIFKEIENAMFPPSDTYIAEVQRIQQDKKDKLKKNKEHASVQAL